MSDIAKELRERSLRAEQEGEPLALLDEAADEIERLRLTDEEREAIAWAINKTAQSYDDAEGGPIKREAMRGLLQRTK